MTKNYAKRAIEERSAASRIRWFMRDRTQHVESHSARRRLVRGCRRSYRNRRAPENLVGAPAGANAETGEPPKAL